MASLSTRILAPFRQQQERSPAVGTMMATTLLGVGTKRLGCQKECTFFFPGRGICSTSRISNVGIFCSGAMDIDHYGGILRSLLPLLFCRILPITQICNLSCCCTMLDELGPTELPPSFISDNSRSGEQKLYFLRTRVAQLTTDNGSVRGIIVE
jgi:hypothetical protein